MQTCEAALAENPDNQHMRYVTALSHAASGDTAALEKHLRAGAEAGYAPAQNALGVALYTGRFGAPDAEGSAWIQRAAEQGYAPAYTNLGGGELGLEVIDLAVLLQGYSRAAELGDPVAMNLIGIAYYHGYGVPDDEANAREWYQRAFEAGNLDATRSLYDLVPTNEGKADWERRALEGGHREALLFGALYSSDGSGGPDLQTAVKAMAAPPLTMQWEAGLRYMEGHFRDSDVHLLFFLIFERRSDYSSWTPADIEQLLQPFREKYDCVGGKLYLRTQAVVGCQKG